MNKKVNNAQPWVLKGLAKCYKTQKKLYAKTLKRDANNDITKSYREYRSVLQKATRWAKRNYYSLKCEDFKRNTKKLWNLINEITKKTTNKGDIIDSLDIDGVISYDSTKIANEFGSYFASIGKNLAEKTPSPEQSVDDYIAKIEQNPRSMFMHPTTKSEIRSLIRMLPNKLSSGYDSINNVLLKKLDNELISPLTLLFNQSIKSGIFPQQIKSADVVPLFKSKNHLHRTNYRPISLLLTISKLLEKVIHKCTYDFLENTSQLYEGQYGFRSKHSCENAIQNLLSDIVKGDTNNKITTAVFLDLSKAFDTLSHPILLKKLERYGVRGKCLTWYESYLNGHDLRSKCQTSPGEYTYSTPQPVVYGTPQGSCLGPLLFTIFTNDLSKHLIFTKCIMFADDTTLYMTHDNPRYLKWCIEQDLCILVDWFKANLLTLNVDKSVSMTFTYNKTAGRNIITGLDISIGDCILPNVNSTKFLGVWLDNSLNWKVHLGKLFLKLQRNTALLRIGGNFLSCHAKKCLYYAQIYSHLSYSLLLWGNMICNTQIKKLQKIQNKCFHLLTKQEPSADNFHSHKLLRIDELIKLLNWKHAHRVQHSHLPVRICQTCKTDSSNISLQKKHRYNTRHKKGLNNPLKASH